MFEKYFDKCSLGDDCFIEVNSCQENIAWARKYLGDFASDEECLEAYEIYRMYRSEGQSDLVSKQYAGLL